MKNRRSVYVTVDRDDYVYFYDAVVELMDDVLRERLHCAIDDYSSPQEFVDAYCAAHYIEYGCDFKVN